MNIAAMRAELIADAHALVSDSDVNRLIVKAMRFHNDRRYWFNEKTFSFALVAGKTIYALGDGPPLDLHEVIGTTLWVLTGGSQDDRWPVERAAPSTLDADRQWGTSVEQPTRWAYFENKFRFYPTPNSSTDVIEGRGVFNVSYPVTKYEAGAFVFYTPDGLRKLSSGEFDGWFNDWTDPRGAGPLVLERARYNLYKDVLHDAEEAQVALNTWLEMSSLLDNETEQRTAGATEIQGTILGDTTYAWGD